MTKREKRKAREVKLAEGRAAGTYVPRRKTHFVRPEIAQVMRQHMKDAPRVHPRLVVEPKWDQRSATHEAPPLTLIIL